MNLVDYARLLAPEWILLLGACAAMLVGVGRDGPRLTAPVSILTVLLALAATLWTGQPSQSIQLPGLHIDGFVHYVRLGGLMVGLLLLMANIHLPVAEERGEFFAMLLLSLCGLLLTAAANDLVVLFFAIELVSVPTYVLVSLSREDVRASEAGVKYFFLGAVAAALMVYGFSFLFGTLGGTTKIAGDESMAAHLASISTVNSLTTIGLALALAGVFFKLAAVPFHAYAPDVYEGAASPVTALLGFLPKFAGFVAAARLLAAFHWELSTQVFWLLWIVAALTMTVGNTLALLQSNVKRILAYSSIAHSGYMLIGLLVGPVAGEGPMRDGLAALLFYMVVYGIMNLGAFAVLAALERRGQAAEELSDVEGLSTRHPGLALALAICCFSLMGFPPTAGLLGKVYIFSSAFSVGDAHPFRLALIALAVIGVINSAIGAAYYLRIIAACYLKPSRVETQRTGGPALTWSLALCSLIMIAVFVWPWTITRNARTASGSVAATINARYHQVADSR